MAAANAAAVEDIMERVRVGSVLGVDALDVRAVIGVGHSMGAMLVLFQQSLHESFDAVASLGYGVTGPITTIGDGKMGIVGAPSYEAIMELGRSELFDNPMPTMRELPEMRHHFYWDDVPADVMAADDLTASTLPGIKGPLSIVPFVATDHAGRVRCHVFIGLGERDSTPNAWDEPRAYRSSSDVTLFVLARSAHCHNSAGTRTLLWDRLGRWAETVRR